ncbi:hypothetical protein [Candidatus Hecatella orcuttiae]|uniref:ammonium transporter n=1 Tax=Candidatus Hecatella orcuttiae TaxID=1935119 RepID=UPI002867C66F|nr:hypothetical protein [Candidatus Hecatella orcuttiae]
MTVQQLAEMLQYAHGVWVEWFYWVTVIVMFFIHIGFGMYEVGVARRKNVGHTLMKNNMLFALILFTFYLFGWWVYGSFMGPNPINAFIPNYEGNPYVGGDFGPLSPFMTGNLQELPPGFMLAFWAAFLLFAQTEGSIISGGMIERCRISSCVVLAVIVGSFVWIWLAAQGWSNGGWMLKWFGIHDAYASGIIHTIAGFFLLGCLINLGPRIGKFDPQGRPRDIPLHNQWMTAVGLFIIVTGFWGFYFACNVPLIIAWDLTLPYWGTVNIFGNPTTLSLVGTNFLMSLAGGMMGGFTVGRGNPFWTWSGVLMGIIGASSGNDLYHPFQAFIIGFITPFIGYKLHYWVERRFKIDDAVGACAVHGYCGFIGLGIFPGFLLWGYPTGGAYYFGFDYIAGVTTPWGQFASALWEAGWAFAIGFVCSWVLKKAKLLRVEPLVELVGLDMSSPAFGDMYPYFPQLPTDKLPEIDRVQYTEIAKYLGKTRSSRGRFASKDAGRKDYLPPASPKEMLEDAIRLQRKLMGGIK